MAKKIIHINDRFDFIQFRPSQAAYYLRRFESLAHEARRLKWELQVRDRHYRLESLASDQPDGIILTLFGHGKKAQEEKRYWSRAVNKYPTIFWASRPSDENHYYVGPDEGSGIDDLLTRLHQLGFRRFGFFGPIKEPYTKERFKAFIEWHDRHRIRIPSEICFPYDPATGDFSSQAKKIVIPKVSDDRFYQRQVRIFSEKMRNLAVAKLPEIFLCDTDTTAKHLISIWGKIPGQTMPGITGYDDISEHIQPWGYNYLSTVSDDLKTQAVKIFGLLNQLFDNRHPTHRQVLVKSRSIIRLQSLPPLPGSSTALLTEQIEAFISQHFREPNLTTLASKKFGLSRQALQRRYSRATGSTWQKRVEKERIYSAADALITSDKTITQIFLEHGYQQHANFARVFKKRFQLSPRAYRKVHRAKRNP